MTATLMAMPVKSCVANQNKLHMSASPTGMLLCWPPVTVLALRQVGRLASHPIRTPSIAELFLAVYLAHLNKLN